MSALVASITVCLHGRSVNMSCVKPQSEVSSQSGPKYEATKMPSSMKTKTKMRMGRRKAVIAILISRGTNEGSSIHSSLSEGPRELNEKARPIHASAGRRHKSVLPARVQLGASFRAPGALSQALATDAPSIERRRVQLKIGRRDPERRIEPKFEARRPRLLVPIIRISTSGRACVLFKR